MTEEELRHALGDRVYDAFAPHGLLTQHDAEDPDNLIHLGQTDQGEDVEINKRAATSRPPGVREHQPGVDGRRPQERGHRPRQLQEPAAPPQPADDAPLQVVHGPASIRAALVQLAHGKAHRGVGGQDLPDRDHAQQRHVPARTSSSCRSGSGSGRCATGPPSPRRRPRSPRHRRALARQIFQSIKSPHALTSVQAGEVEAVHAQTTANVWAQQGVDVEGQTDILTMGLPYICPYNVNSIMNPILVACLGLGYFFNMYRGKPLVREGGVVIMRHPTRPEFHPGHHPSYIDFYEQVLTQTLDPVQMHKEFEESFATDPWYVHLYRTGHAYHGVHPFYMWYWCAHALAHVGRVIVVGGDAKAVRRLGFSPASSLDDALEIASDVVGPSPTLTHLHNPPIFMSDVH